MKLKRPTSTKTNTSIATTTNALSISPSCMYLFLSLLMGLIDLICERERERERERFKISCCHGMAWLSTARCKTNGFKVARGFKMGLAWRLLYVGFVVLGVVIFVPPILLLWPMFCVNFLGFLLIALIFCVCVFWVLNFLGFCSLGFSLKVS